MELSMWDNGTRNNAMVKENSTGQMVLSMRGFGKTITPTVMDG